MDSGFEFFDTWVKTQKGFLETSLKTQESLRDQWLETLRKSQASFLNASGEVENPQAAELLKLVNTWIGAVIHSSEQLNAEVLRLQKTWGTSIETQIEQSKDLVKALSEYLKKSSVTSK
jgi:hypothetical protein